jgi:hypothetical protein
MPRTPDAVAHRLAVDEVGVFQGSQLLQDAGPTRPKPIGQLIGRTRAVKAQAE